mmetsp:Transcript_31125/g.100291  ORF Transcript_31125/g.100291 Transcript_31125/m.100291 type:complete len:224 (+) Transcript_31125:1493-2164(+)
MSSSTKWLPLETNPEVLTRFLRKGGVPSPYGIADVLGLDDELLGMVPQPVEALVVLFPTTASFPPKEPGASSTAYFTEQHIGDACGAIALLHCVFNSSDVDLVPGSPFEKFYEATKTSDPAARGRALIDADDIKDLSNETARQGESAGAGTQDNQCQHFVSFANVDGKVVELDGRNAGPVVHGDTSQKTFLADAAKVIQRDFIQRDPTNLHFSVLAFCRLLEE